MKVSIFKDTFDKTVQQDIDLLRILSAIQKGKWKPEVITLRELRMIDRSEYDKCKKNLPCFTPSGTFKTVREDHLILEYSSVIVLDIDKLNEEDVYGIKALLCEDEYTMACFISPSNVGIKVLVKLDSPPEYHKAAFLSLESYYKSKYNLALDPSGKNISRLCYISFDPELYYASDADVYHVDISAAPPDEKKLGERKFEGKRVSTNVQYIFKVAEVFVKRKHQYVDGQKNPYIHHLSCTMNRCGIAMQDAIYLIDQNYITPDDKWHQSVRSAYFHNKAEHNTVDIYELEKSGNMPEIPAELELSDDEVDNKFMQLTIELLLKDVKVDVVKTLMSAYWQNITTDEFVDSSVKGEIYMRKLLNQAFKKAKQIQHKGKEITISSLSNMADGMFDMLMGSIYVPTGIPELDERLRGGLKKQNVYGMIGREGTYKSLLSFLIGSGNSRKDKQGIYINGEMSDRQFFMRMVKSELGVDLQAEADAKTLTRERFDSITNQLNSSLNNKLHVISSVGHSAADIELGIKRFEEQTGVKVEWVVIDGIGSMYDCEKNEVASAIKNSLLLKEVAKNCDVCIIVLSHTNRDADKHTRDMAEFVRGGQKLTANFDGYFSTSLIIDQKRTNFTSDDIIYRNDMFYVRFFDKRDTGQTIDFVMDVADPLLITPNEFEAKSFEVKPPKKKSYAN